MKDKPKIEFPCRYPIKVIAVASEGAARRVFDIVRKHAPELTALLQRSKQPVPFELARLAQSVEKAAIVLPESGM